MNKVYIAGPITGHLNYLMNFRNAQKMLESKGYDVVNPAEWFLEESKVWTYGEIMGECIKLLADCDAIYMLSGWERSSGAYVEWTYALKNNKEIIYQG